MLVPAVLGVVIFSAALASADVSIYPTAEPTVAGVYGGYNAYNPSAPLPAPTQNLAAQQAPQFNLALTAAPPQNLGPMTPGSLFGFSIEMSLADVVVGRNANVVWPEFLNFMETLKERGGPPVLRVGGNTQEKAQLVGSLPDGDVISKEKGGPSGVTDTPALFFTEDIIHAMKTVTDLVGVTWYMGIPFNQTQPARLDIVASAENILGDAVVGWQLGNEPDLYSLHNFRQDYTQQQYMTDFQDVTNQYNSDTRWSAKKKLGGPSICCLWTQDSVLDLGFLTQFSNDLNTFIIEHYPRDNCNASAHNYADDQLRYLQHSALIADFSGLFEAIQKARQANLPVVLLETNTASCGGILGISDTFTSALWGADLAFALAVQGVSHLMMHLGGQGVFYNPFVPPPFNASAPYLWTAGNVMYSALLVTEALGPTGTARVVDLGANNNADLTPAYAIYEGNATSVPARVVIFNYMSSDAGGAPVTATIQLDSGLPASVKVRYLIAPSVVSKYNTTWGGKSFGGQYMADGLLHGTDTTQTITCANGGCPIQVPAPGAALVFLTAQADDAPADSAVKTWTTTYESRRHNTATVEQAVLQTSNGMSGAQRKMLSSTSFGGGASTSGAGRVGASLLGVVAGVLVAACA